jgi:hypothetical protein
MAMITKRSHLALAILISETTLLIFLAQVNAAPLLKRTLENLEYPRSDIADVYKQLNLSRQEGDLIFNPQATGQDEEGPGRQTSTGPFGPSCQEHQNLPLIALVPGLGFDREQEEDPTKSYWSITTQNQPTFWFYIPYATNSAIRAEFVLMMRDSNGSNRIVSNSKYLIEGTPGIVHIRPSNESNSQDLLIVDQPYYWAFTLKCDLNNGDRDIYVDGHIQRVRVTPENTPPTTLTSEGRAIYFARQGLWNETLSVLLDELYPSEPERAKQRLSELLSSEYVNLEALSQQLNQSSEHFVIQCCEPDEPRN